jgi:hypothetical protein
LDPYRIPMVVKIRGLFGKGGIGKWIADGCMGSRDLSSSA